MRAILVDDLKQFVRRDMAKHELKNKLMHSVYERLINKKTDIPIVSRIGVTDYLPADTEHVILKSSSLRSHLNMPEVNRFIHQLANDAQIKLAGIAIMKDDKLIAEEYVTPYNNRFRHASFSLCKSIVSMAVGIAIQEGLFSVTDRICDYFPEYTGLFTKRWMKQITVEHLLTMTAGVKFDELSSYLSNDWCKDFIGSELGFEPGTKFAYNSLNSYMLAALITKLSGCSLMDYLKSRLFAPLGITDVTWDTCPNGIEQGGWGMKLSLQDMIKLGKLYLDNGVAVVDGRNKQLIPKAWIEVSVKPHVRFCNKKITEGYGYHIWCLKDGAYLFNGVFGQNVYINRKKNLVIACIAGGYELFPEGRLVSKICKFVADDTCFQYHMLDNVMEACINKCKRNVHHFLDKKEDKKYSHPLLNALQQYSDKMYYIEDYASSVFPLANQLLYSTYMPGIEKMSMHVNDEKLIVRFYEKNTTFSFHVGYLKSNPYIYQMLEIGGRRIPVAVGSEIIVGNRECEIVLEICYLEEIANKRIKIVFRDNSIYMQAVDSPNMARFLNKLFGEAMMQRTRKLGKLKKSALLNSKLKKVLFPLCTGTTREKT